MRCIGIVPLVLTVSQAFVVVPGRPSGVVVRTGSPALSAVSSRREAFAAGAAALFGLTSLPKEGSAAPAPVGDVVEVPKKQRSESSSSLTTSSANEVQDGGPFGINFAFVALGYGTLASSFLSGDAECDPCSTIQGDQQMYFEDCSLVLEAQASPATSSVSPTLMSSSMIQGVENFVESENESSEERVKENA